MLFSDLKSGLAEAETRLRELRAEKTRCQGMAATAQELTAEASPGSSGRQKAIEAKKLADKALQDVEQRIAAAERDQAAMLSELSASEGRGGLGLHSVSGWDEASKRLDLQRNELRADVPGQSLLRRSVAAALNPSTPSGGSTAPTPAAVSIRHLYPVFDVQPFGALPGDLAATDFTVSFSPESAAVTGVEIAPATDTEKARVPAAIGLANPEARTFAGVMDSVPARIFDSQASLRALLEQR